MLRVPQYERKVLNDIKAPPLVLSIVEGLRQSFSATREAFPINHVRGFSVKFYVKARQ